MSQRASVPPPPLWPAAKPICSARLSPSSDPTMFVTVIGLSPDWLYNTHLPSTPVSQPVSSITVNPLGSCGHEPGVLGGGGGGSIPPGVVALTTFDRPPNTASTFSVPRNDTSWNW